MTVTTIIVAADMGGGSTGVSINANTTSYSPITGRLVNNATEAQVQTRIGDTLTLGNLLVHVTANTLNGNCVVTSSIGGSPGNLTVTIPSTTTSGDSEDTGHTDSLAVTNLVSWKIDTTNASTGSITLTIISSTLTHASVPSMQYEWMRSTTVNQGTTGYLPINGSGNTNGTESVVQTKNYFAQTYSKLAVYVGANTLSGSCTVRFRVGAGNGNQVVTITPGTANQMVIDATNTDSVAANGLVDYSVVTASGTGSITLYSIQTFCQNNASTNDFQLVLATGQTLHANTTEYAIYGGGGGGSSFQTTESICQLKVRGGNYTMSNLRVLPAANTINAENSVLTNRIGAHPGTLTVTIAHGGVTVQEDTAHSDTVNAGDLIDLQSVSDGSSGTATVNYQVQLTFIVGATPVSASFAGQASGAIGEVDQAYSGVGSGQASGAIGITTDVISASGHGQLTAVGITSNLITASAGGQNTAVVVAGSIQESSVAAGQLTADIVASSLTNSVSFGGQISATVDVSLLTPMGSVGGAMSFSAVASSTIIPSFSGAMGATSITVNTPIPPTSVSGGLSVTSIVTAEHHYIQIYPTRTWVKGGQVWVVFGPNDWDDKMDNFATDLTEKGFQGRANNITSHTIILPRIAFYTGGPLYYYRSVNDGSIIYTTEQIQNP